MQAAEQIVTGHAVVSKRELAGLSTVLEPLSFEGLALSACEDAALLLSGPAL